MTEPKLAVHTIGGVITPRARAAESRAARQPHRDRGDGLESRCPFCARRAAGRNQGGHVQFHEIQVVARTSRPARSIATSRDPTKTRRSRKARASPEVTN